MQIRTVLILCAFSLSTLMSQQALSWGRAGAVGGHKNPSGGYTAGGVHGWRGPQGGATRGWSAVSDGQGNAAATSGGAFRGPGGAQGARAGYTTRSATGNVQHQGGAAWKGRYGQGATQSTFSRTGPRSASGTVSTQYQTNSGAGYQGVTTGTRDQGSLSINHTGTCYDTTGAQVPCPSR